MRHSRGCFFNALYKTSPTRRSFAGRRAGFTILEVAMATCVMAFGISTTIIAMQSGFKQTDLARSSTIAAQIIQSEMERLRMMPWGRTTSPEQVDSISELPSTQTFDGASYFTADAGMAGKYTITRTVGSNATNPAEVKDISVSVRWRTNDGVWHTRSYTAIYAKNGLYDYYYKLAHPST